MSCARPSGTQPRSTQGPLYTRPPMNRWIEELAHRIDTGQRVVLVTVATTRGSTPRAAGAHMVVGLQDSAGSIGGGQLELRAIEHARQMLADDARHTALLRFPLGASVGQCCGGVVQLAFEPIDGCAHDWIHTARLHAAANTPWGRIVAIGADNAAMQTRVFDATQFDTADGRARLIAAFNDRAVAERAASVLAGHANGATLAGARPDGSADWLIDVTVPPELHVVMFGAGHVGRALAEVLARLPVRLTWVDTRDDSFPPTLPSGIDVRCTDTPLSEVGAAPAAAVFLVLTHSHALDLELVRAILDRGDFRYCGMIGSHAKRDNFEQRLRARGYTDTAIARLNCPIGAPGIIGKEPEIIAIAVAAELLQLRGASFAARPAQREATLAPR